MSAPDRVRVEFHEQLFAAMVPEYQSDIHCFIEFENQLDFERLQQAVLTALAESPMWAYRFQQHWWRSHWQRIPRAERRSLITLHETNDLRATEQAVLTGPVTAGVSVAVLRTPDADTIIFRVDHRLADASAAREFIAAVRKHYDLRSQEPAEDGPVMHVTPEVLTPVATPAERWELLKRRMRETKHLNTRPQAFQTPRPQSPEEWQRLPRLMQYPTGALNALRERALQDRVTPPIALQAACYLALRDLVNPKPGTELPVATMVDLRRYVPKETPVGSASMLLGVVRQLIPVDRPHDISAIIAELNAGLRAQRGRWFGLVDSPLVAELPALKFCLRLLPDFRIRKRLRDSIFNRRITPELTVTDQGDYGTPGDTWGDTVQKIGFCSTGVWGLPAISVGFCTSGSRFTVSVAIGPDSFSRQLAERIDHYLTQYVGWPANYGELRPQGLSPATPA